MIEKIKKDIFFEFEKIPRSRISYFLSLDWIFPNTRMDNFIFNLSGIYRKLEFSYYIVKLHHKLKNTGTSNMVLPEDIFYRKQIVTHLTYLKKDFKKFLRKYRLDEKNRREVEEKITVECFFIEEKNNDNIEKLSNKISKEIEKFSEQLGIYQKFGKLPIKRIYYRDFIQYHLKVIFEFSILVDIILKNYENDPCLKGQK